MAAVRPLYVEKDEGVGSIVSRLEETGDKNLALVFPQDSEVFSDIVELKFLKKQVEKTEKRVVLITRDDAQAELAESLGFKVKKDLEADFEDEFLESFYQEEGKQEKQQEKGTKEQPKEATETTSESKSKREGGLKKKRLQVSDIVDPQKNKKKKREKQTTSSKKSKQPQKEQPRKEEKQNSSIEEVYERESRKDKSKTQTSNQESSGSGFWGWFSFPRVIGILFLSSIVALGLTVTYVFPEAEVGIEPRDDTKETAFSLTIDKSIMSPDLEKNLIPGEVFKQRKKVKKTFESTGEEEVEKKARGTVKIYNSFSSNPQTLVKTTRLLSESGKLFRLVNTIEVPGADITNGKVEPNYIEAEVVADEPGSEYNIEPGEFTIPGFEDSPQKYEGFYAISEKPMEGGKVGKIQKVTEKDKEQALAELEEDLLSEVKNKLQESIPEDLQVMKESLKLEFQGTKLEPKVGEEGEQFQVQATGTAKTFALREDYVKRIIKKKLEKSMEEGQKIVEGGFDINYKDPALNFEEGTATFKVEASVDITWEIKKESLKEALKGKNEVGARKAVADYPEIKSLQVQLWPFWLRQIPDAKGKIKIKVQD